MEEETIIAVPRKLLEDGIEFANRAEESIKNIKIPFFKPTETNLFKELVAYKEKLQYHIQNND